MSLPSEATGLDFRRVPPGGCGDRDRPAQEILGKTPRYDRHGLADAGGRRGGTARPDVLGGGRPAGRRNRRLGPEALEAVRAETGVPVHPDSDTFRTIQDRLVQKRRLEDAGIPVAPPVRSRTEAIRKPRSNPKRLPRDSMRPASGTVARPGSGQTRSLQRPKPVRSRVESRNPRFDPDHSESASPGSWNGPSPAVLWAPSCLSIRTGCLREHPDHRSETKQPCWGSPGLSARNRYLSRIVESCSLIPLSSSAWSSRVRRMSRCVCDSA